MLSSPVSFECRVDYPPGDSGWFVKLRNLHWAYGCIFMINIYRRVKA